MEFKQLKSRLPILGTLSVIVLGGSLFFSAQSIKAAPEGNQVIIESDSESKNYFFVREDNGVPRTYIRTRQEPIPFIEWSSLYFAKIGYPPEVRAAQVTNRINKYFNQCPSLKITHGMLPGKNGGEIPVILAVGNEEVCNGLVYTLKSELDGEQTVIYLADALKQAFNQDSSASGTRNIEIRREAGCPTHINIQAIIDGDVNNIAEKVCSQ